MHFFVHTNPHLLTTGLSATSAPRAVSKFEMPAMSPTMTVGGIASWKKRGGDSFTAGNMLLEIVCPRQFSTSFLQVVLKGGLMGEGAARGELGDLSSGAKVGTSCLALPAPPAADVEK